jgi:2'-deoxynucleoside 5'-phosphate N-hydrolase
MKIYFAGSIRGGRDHQPIYFQIIEHLKKTCTVLTEHVSDIKLTAAGEAQENDEWIFNRDMTWLNEADVLVAEVTNPSLGVGYEISKAESAGKPVICLYRKSSGRSLSAMIAGNKNLEIVHYDHPGEAFKQLDSFLAGILKNA